MRYRKWFIDRLCRHFEDRSSAIDKVTGDGNSIPMGEIASGGLKF